MITTDKISDLIISIKNAAKAGKETVQVSHTNQSAAIAQALERAGFVEVVGKKGKKIKKQIELRLVYAAGVPKLNDARRVSKPSKRIYRGVGKIAPVKRGFGCAIISTPKGVITDKEARKDRVGGEVLFQVW
ncbi:30S ribosomal protein S8 [Patescibacteria group bacterium]|nr:30S ribosomal protein S8 [Patescibacteria group bacterium]